MQKLAKLQLQVITPATAIKLIDECDNEILLEEAKELLLASTIKDWWEELTDEDKNLVMESESQYNQGDFISHQELMKQFDEWKNK